MLKGDHELDFEANHHLPVLPVIPVPSNLLPALIAYSEAHTGTQPSEVKWTSAKTDQ